MKHLLSKLMLLLVLLRYAVVSGLMNIKSTSVIPV